VGLRRLDELKPCKNNTLGNFGRSGNGCRGIGMKCPECEKRDFMIEELQVQIRDLEREILRLRAILKEKGHDI